MRSWRPAASKHPAGGLLVALLLAGCTGSAAYRTGAASGSPYDGPVPYDGTDPAAETSPAGAASPFAPSRFYPPPGPATDPWGPYIHEAASRFGIPDQWVRAVMKQESQGQQQAVSPVGAMGLMQVMPATYAGLRARHHLGADPFDPHDNILAGAAYIREMFDRYGSPGFLAAYNAGPDRLDAYLQGGTPLPDETVNYLAAITPNLGAGVSMSGPLASYAAGASTAAPPSAESFAAGCDANAAFDPDHPCARLEQAATAPAIPVAYHPAPAGWAIQVGAFTSAGLARAVAEGARDEAQLPGAQVAVPVTSPFGGAVYYRARVTGLSATAAQSACDRLNQRQLPCIVVRPEPS